MQLATIRAEIERKRRQQIGGRGFHELQLERSQLIARVSA